MKLKIGILIVLFIFLNCNSNHKTETIPEILKTNYGKIDDKNLNLKFGDLVEFQIEKLKITAVVLDISQENNETWFGLCFIQQNKLFGRKIPQGFNGNCIDLYDINYIKENGIKNYKILQNLKIDFNKVSPGSYNYIITKKEILDNYNLGIKERKQKETPCKEKLLLLDPVNECYLPLNKIKK